MNLAEKLKEAKEESFEKWFERWYEEQNLEKKLMDSARQGYSGFAIRIQEDYENDVNLHVKRKYRNRRLRDPRTAEKLSDELGEGIKVEYKYNRREVTIFGLKSQRFNDWIEITW